MNKDDLKKILAGFSIAGLLSVAVISSPGHAASG
jgi:radical SAM modification target selenobiotic family peptide